MIANRFAGFLRRVGYAAVEANLLLMESGPHPSENIKPERQGPIVSKILKAFPMSILGCQF